jgi:hypothetical protein
MAIKCYEQALEIAKELGNSHEGNIARNAIEELSRIAGMFRHLNVLVG